MNNIQVVKNDQEIALFEREFPNEKSMLWAGTLFDWFKRDSLIKKFARISSNDKGGSTKSIIGFVMPDDLIYPSPYTFQQLVSKAIAGNKDAVIWYSPHDVVWTAKQWEPESIKRVVTLKVICERGVAIGEYQKELFLKGNLK